MRRELRLHLSEETKKDIMVAARALTFSDPGVGGEGGLGLLHEAAGQQLERALLEAVRPEQAAPDGADVDGAVHRLPRPKQQLQKGSSRH